MNTQVISLQRGWKFCYGDVKRWERVDHDTCYLTTKTGYEFGTPEVFLNENDWIDVGVPHDWNTAQVSDPTAHPNNGIQPDITEDIETFCGRCQAIVRPDEEDRVHVIVSCDGLEDVEYVR